MSGMYFDAVLDDRMNPIFNASTEETVAWLEDRREFDKEVQVCVGKTMQFLTVEEYLQQFG